jgi:hypothetical protein
MLPSTRLPGLIDAIHSIAPDSGSVVSATDGVCIAEGPPYGRPFCYLSYGIWWMGALQTSYPALRVFKDQVSQGSFLRPTCDTDQVRA